MTEPGNPQHPVGGLRELLRIALPLIVSAGSLSLMHVVDRILLNWYSMDALAASTPGGMLHWTLMSLSFGIAIYTNTFVAQYDGAGRESRVAASVWQASYLALAGGILLAVLCPWTARMTAWFGHPPEIQVLEQQYFTILSVGTAPALLSAVLSSFFSGLGRTRVVMVVNITISLLNGLVSWVLIFGRWGFPELGIRGAGFGTVIAEISGCLLFLAVINFGRDRGRYPFSVQWRLDLALIRRMLRYGFPNGVQFLVDVGAYLTLIVIIGRIGKPELAATVMAFNLNSLAFIPMFGLGMAVATLVGRRVGEQRSTLAIRTTWMAFGLAVCYVLGWIVGYLFLPDLLLKPYAAYSDPSEFEQVRPVVTQLLYFVAMYSVFDAMAIVFGSAIRGAGDTRFSLYFTGLTVWLLMVLPVWILWNSGGGLHACWTVVCVQIAVLGCGFLLRFRQGRWLSMSVIEEPDPFEPEIVPAI